MILIFLSLIAITTIYGERISDQEYIESIEYKLLIPSTEINIYNRESLKELNYTPSTNSTFGLDINLMHFSLGATFKDGRTESDEDENSQDEISYYKDFTFKKIINNGLLKVYYLKYSGFKIEDVDDNSQDLLDITARSYGINYTFLIDSTLKLSQIMGSFEHKKTTDYGSFLTFAYSKNKLNSKDSLIPSGSEEDFKSFAGLESFDQDAISAIYGVAGTYTKNKFYIQGSIGLGINYSQTQYKGTDIKNTKNTGPASKGYLNFGYQFQKALLGIEVSTLSSADLQGDTELALKRNDSSIYYHYFF